MPFQIEKINRNLNVPFFSYIMILMSTIKYPGAIDYSNCATTVKDHHSKRGMFLENDVNESNEFYRECNRALIYKKPTPVQVVRVDYPARNKAKIVEAYYRSPSTTDYNGVYRGKYIDFEAKETKNKTQFPISMIHSHQIKHLKKVKYHGGIGFFLIRFNAHGQTFLIDSQDLIHELEQAEKSYIPYNWFVEHGIVIKEGLYPRLSYLDALDIKYFKEDV